MNRVNYENLTKKNKDNRIKKETENILKNCTRKGLSLMELQVIGHQLIVLAASGGLEGYGIIKERR